MYYIFYYSARLLLVVKDTFSSYFDFEDLIDSQNLILAQAPAYERDKTHSRYTGMVCYDIPDGHDTARWGSVPIMRVPAGKLQFLLRISEQDTSNHPEAPHSTSKVQGTALTDTTISGLGKSKRQRLSIHQHHSNLPYTESRKSFQIQL